MSKKQRTPDDDSFRDRLEKLVKGAGKEPNKSAETSEDQPASAPPKPAKSPDDDSFRDRLEKLVKGTEKASGEPAEIAEDRPAPPEPAKSPDDDSFRGRLDKLLGEDEAEDGEEEALLAEEGTPEEELSQGPVGAGDHVVKPGECISSIAKNTGHFWKTIWNDPGNAGLREVREDPNVLLPDDRVTIPPLGQKEEPGQSEQRHRFVRRGEPAKLVIGISVNDEPRAHEPYNLIVDGRTFTGFTDTEGKLRVPVPGDAREAKLLVGPEGKELEYDLGIGEMDPLTEIIGLQRRLNNLGYDCGEEDDMWGPATQGALQDFQQKHGLKPATGEPDSATRAKLREVYGC